VRGYWAIARLSILINRDLRRAALFLWMIPFSAALSRALTASLTISLASSILPSAMSFLAFLMKVRARERNIWLRSLLLAELLMRFFADAVFAKVLPPSFL